MRSHPRVSDLAFRLWVGDRDGEGWCYEVIGAGFEGFESSSDQIRRVIGVIYIHRGLGHKHAVAGGRCRCNWPVGVDLCPGEDRCSRNMRNVRPEAQGRLLNAVVIKNHDYAVPISFTGQQFLRSRTHVNIRLEHAFAPPRSRHDLQAIFRPAGLDLDSIEIGRSKIPAVILGSKRHDETIGRYRSNNKSSPG